MVSCGHNRYSPATAYHPAKARAVPYLLKGQDVTTTERSLFVVANYRQPHDPRHRLRREPGVLDRVVRYAQQPFKMLTRWARRLTCQIRADRFARWTAQRRAKQQSDKQRIQHLTTLRLRRDERDSYAYCQPHPPVAVHDSCNT